MNAKTNQSQEYETPAWLFNQLNGEFAFTVDAASNHKNALLPYYWTEEEDGLNQDWSVHRVFCNPPFKQAAHWAAKAATNVESLSVLILPAFTDQAWYHTNCRLSNVEVRPIRGRVHYLIDGKPPINPRTGKPSGPRFPSIVVIWRPFHWLNIRAAGSRRVR
jgi:site-specific DNA-methyltransferase (adenine-specific)